MSSDLSGRYGSDRTVLFVVIGIAVTLPILLVTLIVSAFLGWLVWAIVYHANPEVTSSVTGYEVVDAHTVTAVVDVDLDDDAEDVNCRVEAVADDHSVVGTLDFEPVDGRNEVAIPTEREATQAKNVGCTANGQRRPR